MKLEIGSGRRPTPGYIHNDLNAFADIDIVGNPWEISLPDNSLEEAIALGVMEHLTYDQFGLTLTNMHRLLKPGGQFYFDVPDIVAWCRYVVDHFDGKQIPFPIEHVFATLYGWQRWPGDEHKSGWHKPGLEQALAKAGFSETAFGVEHMLAKGFTRNRFARPHDVHFYCVATKT
jgi:predicted SAM-dependent methyltransferase